MLPRGATNFPSAVIFDEDHDENKDIKEFYENNLLSLKKCPWNLISYSIIKNIAVTLNATKSSDEEWRKYAEAMGIDNKTIAEIKAQAYCHRELEIFFAMDRIVRQRLTFGHIIDALLQTERYDVLREIEPFVRNILSKISERQTNSSAHSKTCKFKNDTEEHYFTEKHSASFSEQKPELNYFQEHSINDHFKKALQISVSSKFSKENLEEKKVPSAPAEDKITVLIQHAESENDIAEDLAKEFEKQGVFATTLTEVNDLTYCEPVNVLDTVFKEVDFIVPILSEKFMKEIHPENQDEYLDSVYTQNNRRLYTLIMHEYTSNRCVNFRVRPVIVEGMSRRSSMVGGTSQSCIIEPIFALAFRLPKEVPKLVRVLKKTKELRAQ